MVSAVKSCTIPGSRMFKLSYSYLEVGVKTKALSAIVLAVMLSYAMLQLFITSHMQMADSLCYNKDIL